MEKQTAMTKDCTFRLNKKARERGILFQSSTAARVTKVGLHQRRLKSKKVHFQEIKAYAKKLMGTLDVRIDANLSRAIWTKGSRGALNMRIRMSRTKNESVREMGDRPYYTLVTYVKTPEEEFQELLAKTAQTQAEIPQRRLHTVSESDAVSY